MSQHSMRSSVATRLTLGLGSSLANQILGAIQMFALTPFFMTAWGVEVYGKWVVISSIISYLNLADFGGQTYIANALAIHFARDNRDAFKRTLGEAVSLFLFLGVSLFGAVVFAVVLFMHVNLPGLGRPLVPWEAQTLTLLAASFLLLSFPGGVYVTAYRATGNYTRGTTAYNSARLFTLSICLGILLLGGAPREFAAGQLLATFLSQMGIVYDLRRSIPLSREISIGFHAAKTARRHLTGAIPFWLIAIAQAIGQQGMVIVLAMVASPAIVALYATHRSMSAVSGYIGPTLQAPLLPEFSFLYSQERSRALRNLTLLAIESNVLLTGVIAIFIWWAAPLIYPLWTNYRLHLNPVLLALILLQGVVASIWSATSWPLLAANRHRLVAAFMTLSSVAALCGTYLIVKAVGVLGVPVAALIADLLFVVPVTPILAARFLSVPVIQIFASMGKSIAFVALLASVSVVVNLPLPSHRVIPLLVVSITAAIYILGKVKAHLRSATMLT